MFSLGPDQGGQPSSVYGALPMTGGSGSGGSSGGEGALIGLKGSPLGVGSDIGGYVAQ